MSTIAMRRVGRRPIIGGFETVNISALVRFLSSFFIILFYLYFVSFNYTFFFILLKDCLEITPDFLEEFGDKLKTTWKVTDNDGKNHNLQLNEDLSLPLLTNGFITLRDQYQLQNMQQIFFYYLGQSRFLIQFGKVYDNTNNLPSYHSRSTKEGKTIYFDITLNQLQMARATELVKFIF
jgi:hypothetical protein